MHLVHILITTFTSHRVTNCSLKWAWSVSRDLILIFGTLELVCNVTRGTDNLPVNFQLGSCYALPFSTYIQTRDRQTQRDRQTTAINALCPRPMGV